LWGCIFTYITSNNRNIYVDDIITYLGHWLGEVYVSRGHRTTLALQLVAVGVMITGAITARDYAGRRKQLKEYQTTKLAIDSLSMTLVSDDRGTPTQYSATVTKEDHDYRLSIVKTSGTTQKTTTNEYFRSLDEVENYLRENTPFLLSDFK